MDLSGAYLNLGVSTEKSGDLDGARDRYNEAIAAYPNAQAHYNLAVTYWGKDWPRALENLEACLRINPQFPDGAKFLAMARMKAGRL
jgi:tetratricopeptide (TPR) repeat protein